MVACVRCEWLSCVWVCDIYVGLLTGGGCLLFFFKQKTAYEMRISDWSSDVCSSDLFRARDAGVALVERADRGGGEQKDAHARAIAAASAFIIADEIGRASCRERVCQYV